jgi:opacity protein-like surface antigen
MKSKFLLYFLFLLFSLPSFVFAQKKSEPKEKKDPYQLMSEYYGDQFNPFDKGNWYLGFAFSLQNQQLTNKARLFEKVLDGNSLNYNLAFRGGYFLADYLSVGGSFVYSRDKFTGLVIQDSDTLQRNNIRSAGTAIAFLRTSFPLTKNKRLSFFNEIGLGLGGGNAVIRDIKNQDEIQKSYSDEFIFTAGISPGITFFAIENFAFEIQLSNLIGYTLNSTKTTTNDTEEAQVVTHNVNFNINLLSLNLGLAYFFGAKKNR